MDCAFSLLRAWRERVSFGCGEGALEGWVYHDCEVFCVLLGVYERIIDRMGCDGTRIAMVETGDSRSDGACCYVKA